MTRVAMGASGWRICELAGDGCSVIVQLTPESPEVKMSLHEAQTFANRLATIASNLRDTPAPSPELLDQFFDGADEVMAQPSRRICRICHAECSEADAPAKLFGAGVCSEPCMAARKKQLGSGVEPPGGLERPHRIYQHGKRRR